MTLPLQQSEAVATMALAFKFISDPPGVLPDVLACPVPEELEPPGENMPPLLLN